MKYHTCFGWIQQQLFINEFKSHFHKNCLFPNYPLFLPIFMIMKVVLWLVNIMTCNNMAAAAVIYCSVFESW